MVLGIVVVMAVVASAAAFAALNVALSRSRRPGVFSTERYLRARYAAEAGVVWATQQLWGSPTECFDNPPSPYPEHLVDDDADPGTPAIPVDIIATPCPTDSPPNEVVLRAVVSY
ncbi:MAG TPA: hypothetical protein DDX89_07210 [Candidatus Omnitrophica bacterium]|nr:hypothetical protein [Candidatus Omnitrophota bacterium]